MKRKIIWVTLLVLCIVTLLFSGRKLYTIYDEYKKSEVVYEETEQAYVVHPTETSFPQTELESYETAPFSVDFDALIAECEDVVGWLYCADTPVSYPVVQSSDNDWYLRRLMDGSYSIGGTIFMDYRNSSDFSDWNSIIYGHNMKNDSMFGVLPDYRNQDFFLEHPVWYLLTPKADYKIVLVGGYTTPATDTVTYAIPENVRERDQLLEQAITQSTFQSETVWEDDDRIITLSTCSYDYEDARYVLVGLLRELNRTPEGG